MKWLLRDQFTVLSFIVSNNVNIEESITGIYKVKQIISTL